MSTLYSRPSLRPSAPLDVLSLSTQQENDVEGGGGGGRAGASCLIKCVAFLSVHEPAPPQVHNGAPLGRGGWPRGGRQVVAVGPLLEPRRPANHEHHTRGRLRPPFLTFLNFFVIRVFPLFVSCRGTWRDTMTTRRRRRRRRGTHCAERQRDVLEMPKAPCACARPSDTHPPAADPRVPARPGFLVSSFHFPCMQGMQSMKEVSVDRERTTTQSQWQFFSPAHVHPRTSAQRTRRARTRSRTFSRTHHNERLRQRRRLRL